MQFPGWFGRAILISYLTLATAIPARAQADPAFAKFIAELWPQAQALGVARATFDAVTRGLQPDLALPDLEIPGRAEKPPEQPEFVQPPAAYLSEAAISRLAAQGRKLAEQYRTTLVAIERRFGVPGNVLVAIWGRETAFGTHELRHNAIRVLATQAYLGRRKAQFRQEFLHALKLLDERHATAAELRSSWAGAMGHMQLLPSDFFKHAVDFDGDGRRDIWNSVPDALASAANQLVHLGWQRGTRWAMEVRVPPSVDCTIAEPGFKLSVGYWLKRGYRPAHDGRLSQEELEAEASLLLPAGLYGPGFLVLRNYFVLKDYNFSDLYVLFVGHLSDRIGDGRPFERAWDKLAQLPSTQLEELQRRLTAQGYYRDKIDGKAGMLTRAALGRYQKSNGLKLDCWPTTQVLEHMRQAGERPR